MRHAEAAIGTLKGHTVFLVGELGGEPSDPPVDVEVTGHLALSGGADAHRRARGVTPRPAATTTTTAAVTPSPTRDGEAAPSLLADLGDHDNYVELCLASRSPALRVRFAPGVVMAPRGDANPGCSVEVSGPADP